jgi:hypothetical protein
MSGLAAGLIASRANLRAPRSELQWKQRETVPASQARAFEAVAELARVVRGGLKQRWSLGQISRWLRRRYPRKPDWHVCTETIFEPSPRARHKSQNDGLVGHGSTRTGDRTWRDDGHAGREGAYDP